MLVHLPIGILAVCLLIQVLASYPRFQQLGPAIPFLLICGAISALLSCLSGYTLSIVYSYPKALLNLHMWSGIAIAMFSLLIYIRVTQNRLDLTYKLLSVGMLLLLIGAGYLGGRLAHRPDHYRSERILITPIQKP